MGETEEVETNLLLSDITVLLPTLSGLPLSYTVSGTANTEKRKFFFSSRSISCTSAIFISYIHSLNINSTLTQHTFRESPID